MAGGMGVKKNIHIENWAGFRENCEHVFKFSRANWARFAVFGVIVPVMFYRGILNEFETPGQAVGRGPERFGRDRYYWGGSLPRSSASADEKTGNSDE